jgi:hypothetical protein
MYDAAKCPTIVLQLIDSAHKAGVLDEDDAQHMARTAQKRVTGEKRSNVAVVLGEVAEAIDDKMKSQTKNEIKEMEAEHDAVTAQREEEEEEEEEGLERANVHYNADLSNLDDYLLDNKLQDMLAEAKRAREAKEAEARRVAEELAMAQRLEEEKAAELKRAEKKMREAKRVAEQGNLRRGVTTPGNVTENSQDLKAVSPSSSQARGSESERKAGSNLRITRERSPALTGSSSSNAQPPKKKPKKSKKSWQAAPQSDQPSPQSPDSGPRTGAAGQH